MNSLKAKSTFFIFSIWFTLFGVAVYKAYKGLESFGEALPKVNNFQDIVNKK